MAEVKLVLTSGLQARAQVRDVAFIADEPLEQGGTNEGPTPVEMLTAALGACAAMTARLYANRKGWPLESVEVSVSHQKIKAADYPAYSGESDFVNEFRQVITFTGDLTDEQKQRLLEITGKCPVHRILTQPNFMFEELAVDEPQQFE
jgi:uncharacterized OsmC-like protein